MRTLVFKAVMSDSDQQVVRGLQRDYSISFRKMYANMELMEDPTFLASLPISSKKQMSYLQKEVLAFHKRDVAARKKRAENIEELEAKEKLDLKEFKRLQRLKRTLDKKVCFGDKAELKRLSKGNGNREKWTESRLLPLVFYGETARKGNRFFDLKELDKGKLQFNLESTSIKVPIEFNTRKHHAVLQEIHRMAMNKELAVTIKLSHSKLFICYDESIVCGTKLDIKAFYQEIRHVDDKDERRHLIHQRHKQHEAVLTHGTMDRVLAIDLNPDGIGCCVLGRDNKVVHKEYYDLSSITDARKRRYETTIVVKDLFKKVRHFRCHSIVVEELNLKPEDVGNRKANRKINNLWNRKLISELIGRRCNENGVLRIDINPVYTSFIGNVLHNEYDPIAASIEIGRRGMNKYIKGEFYPELDFTYFINDKRYDEIKGCPAWKDLYSLFVTSKWNYRRKLERFNFAAHPLEHVKSGARRLCFQ